MVVSRIHKSKCQLFSYIRVYSLTYDSEYGLQQKFDAGLVRRGRAHCYPVGGEILGIFLRRRSSNHNSDMILARPTYVPAEKKGSFSQLVAVK